MYVALWCPWHGSLSIERIIYPLWQPWHGLQIKDNLGDLGKIKIDNGKCKTALRKIWMVMWRQLLAEWHWNRFGSLVIEEKLTSARGSLVIDERLSSTCGSLVIDERLMSAWGSLVIDEKLTSAWGSFVIINERLRSAEVALHWRKIEISLRQLWK